MKTVFYFLAGGAALFGALTVFILSGSFISGECRLIGLLPAFFTIVFIIAFVDAWRNYRVR